MLEILLHGFSASSTSRKEAESQQNLPQQYSGQRPAYFGTTSSPKQEAISTRQFTAASATLMYISAVARQSFLFSALCQCCLLIVSLTSGLLLRTPHYSPHPALLRSEPASRPCLCGKPQTEGTPAQQKCSQRYIIYLPVTIFLSQCNTAPEQSIRMRCKLCETLEQST